MEESSIPSDTYSELFKAAKEGDWVELRNIISDRGNFNDFMLKDPDTENFTILHHACNNGKRETALNGVRSIFDAVKSFAYDSDQLFEFVNQKDSSKKGRTALHIAIENGYCDVIMLLLNKGADVDIQKISGIKSKMDKENDSFRESEQLATILDHPNANQTDILSHPFPQLFLLVKRKRYQFLIWFSIFYHIIWSILSATYITCNVISFSKNDSSNEKSNMSDSKNWIPCNNLFFSYFLLPTFGLVMLIKEITELTLSRSKWYYFNQAENWGQWVVLVIVALVALLNLSGTMISSRGSSFFILCLFGLASSLVLIQAQFTKIETLGVYLQLMNKGFWKILKLLLVFLPLLAAYLLVFRLLMPANSSYYITWGLGIGKILAGMTGELNYDELFEDESVDRMINEYAVKAVQIFFIISIVILFQNMLIALSFNDIEKLKAKATVAHLATTLEVIYLMEAFLMHDNILCIFEFFNLKDKVVHHFCVNELKSHSSSKSTNNGALNTNTYKNHEEIPLKTQQHQSVTVDIGQHREVYRTLNRNPLAKNLLPFRKKFGIHLWIEYHKKKFKLLKFN